MDIKNAKFITSLSEYKGFDNNGLKQIAMVGKSNVGKSSLINALCNQKKLCKTSSTPGKTRLINIFEATLYDDEHEETFHIVDLPGYGYAKVSNAEKVRWGKMIENYLVDSQLLYNLFHLVDIRHDPTGDDVIMNNFLRHNDLNYTVIATKSDKISRASQGKNIASICRKLQVQPWEVIPFSSESKIGRDKVLEQMAKILFD